MLISALLGFAVGKLLYWGRSTGREWAAHMATVVATAYFLLAAYGAVEMIAATDGPIGGRGLLFLIGGPAIFAVLFYGVGVRGVRTTKASSPPPLPPQDKRGPV
jgi:hypothetical protein